jgi:hypothetical protein
MARLDAPWLPLQGFTAEFQFIIRLYSPLPNRIKAVE